MQPRNRSGRFAVILSTIAGGLIQEAKSVKEITLYIKQPPPPDFFQSLKELISRNLHATVEIVVEDFHEIEYLYSLYSAGFSLFRGLGLPAQPILFLERRRGFVLDCGQANSSPSFRPLKRPEDIYFRLLWRRFGNAVALSGTVKEVDRKSGMFSLATDGGREQWCRLKDSTTAKVPPVGVEIQVFAWDKWVTHILEVLDVTVLEKHKAGPR
jgi:hypothetical protein